MCLSLHLWTNIKYIIQYKYTSVFTLNNCKILMFNCVKHSFIYLNLQFLLTINNKYFNIILFSVQSWYRITIGQVCRWKSTRCCSCCWTLGITYSSCLFKSTIITKKKENNNHCFVKACYPSFTSWSSKLKLIGF